MRMYGCFILLSLAPGVAHAERFAAGAFVRPIAGPVRVSGVLRDRADGSVIDALADRAADGTERPGWIDLEAGGLRVRRADPARHAYELEPSGVPGRACANGGACLVSRMLPLAVARLVTQEELAERLAGDFEVEALEGELPSRRVVLIEFVRHHEVMFGYVIITFVLLVGLFAVLGGADSRSDDVMRRRGYNG